MDTFSRGCLDLLISSVSLVNQIEGNHNIEKFGGRNQIHNKIKGPRSTSVCCADNQKLLNSRFKQDKYVTAAPVSEDYFSSCELEAVSWVWKPKYSYKQLRFHYCRLIL